MKPSLTLCLAACAAFLVIAASGSQAQTTRYTASADGQEVTDSQTNLIWRRCAEGMNWDGSTCSGAATSFTHEAALQRAAAQAASTGKAWRLPNVKELSSIADKSRSSPAIDPTAFPATPSSWFWSASPGVGGSGGSGDSWGVDFNNGHVLNDFRYYAYVVRLVRDNPSTLPPTVSISASPTRVRSGDTSAISWNSTNVTSCAVTRNGVAWKTGLLGVNVSSDPVVGQTTFIATCQTNGSPSTVTSKVLVNIGGSFREF